MYISYLRRLVTWNRMRENRSKHLARFHVNLVAEEHQHWERMCSTASGFFNIYRETRWMWRWEQIGNQMTLFFGSHNVNLAASQRTCFLIVVIDSSIRSLIPWLRNDRVVNGPAIGNFPKLFHENWTISKAATCLTITRFVALVCVRFYCFVIIIHRVVFLWFVSIV